MNIDKQKISVALENLLKHNKKLEKAVLSEEIKNIWFELMNEDVVNQTKKIRFKKGKLIIKLDSAPLRQNLTYRSEEIINNLNESLKHPQRILEIQFI